VIIFILGNELGSYNISPNSTSLSGLSSGAYFSTQFQIAYSSSVIGSGSIAGGPFACAELSMVKALTTCMSSPMTINVRNLVNLAKRYESEGNIDSLSNLKNHKNYILHGRNDYTVRIEASHKLSEFYKTIGADNILMKDDINAGHAMLTDDFGNSCSDTRTPWINNCRYSASRAILEEFYGRLENRVEPIRENLLTFNQRTYPASSFGSTGFIYVPTKCKNQEKCKLHIHFHGCNQYYDSPIKDTYVKHAGFNGWAESNSIIVLYPQTTSSSFMPFNPQGCFDFWGYSGNDAYFKTGSQMTAVKKMIDKISKK